MHSKRKNMWNIPKIPNQQERNSNPTNPNPNNPSIYYDIHLSLKHSSSSTFNLENAVCSHGLFLMAPNHWDPHTKSLLRPLHLSLSSPAASALVRISSGQCGDTVLVRVYGVPCLSLEEKEAVVCQVQRMLRLSEREEKKVREFHELHSEAKMVGFGRVFRSPTLFEDMVKAILFCNCQWPRTLSMAKALCDLQLELQCCSSTVSVNSLGDTKSEVAINRPESFAPGTPAVKESGRKRKMHKIVSKENAGAMDDSKDSVIAKINAARTENGIQVEENMITTFGSSTRDENNESTTLGLGHIESSGVASERIVMPSTEMIGNFPSPIELACLDEKYLAKRCGLGYRAGRVLKLAQGVIEGRIQLDQFEELSEEASLCNYNKVDEKLKEIEGYGPFTRGNVLICLGFFNVVPSDSETIRHLKQVHKKTTTVQNIQKVVEEMYRRYEPYQFLAYWWEIWTFYERHFGKFSEMPSSEYKLITASNMKTKKEKLFLIIPPLRGLPKTLPPFDNPKTNPPWYFIF